MRHSRTGVRRGYQASVLTGDDRERSWCGAGPVSQRVDGLILTTARTDGSHPLLHELKASGVAYSLAMRTDRQGPAAVGDDELGVSRPAPDRAWPPPDRLRRRPGIRLQPQGRAAGPQGDEGRHRSARLVHYSSFSMEAGEEIGLRLLALAELPTAVFTANAAWRSA